MKNGKVVSLSVFMLVCVPEQKKAGTPLFGIEKMRTFARKF